MILTLTTHPNPAFQFIIPFTHMTDAQTLDARNRVEGDYRRQRYALDLMNRAVEAGRRCLSDEVTDALNTTLDLNSAERPPSWCGP